MQVTAMTQALGLTHWKAAAAQKPMGWMVGGVLPPSVSAAGAGRALASFQAIQSM